MDLIHFIFIGFGIFRNNIYSLKIICTNLYTNIQFHAKKIHFEANICFRANIHFIFFHAGKYLLQNIHFKANICKTSSNLYIQANVRLPIFAYKQIFACKYSHTSKYLLQIVSNYIGKPFTSLGPQLIFGSFWKYLLRKEHSISFFCFTCKIRLFSSMQNQKYSLHTRLYSLQTEYFVSP